MPRYRRGAGAVERAGLENRYTRKRIVGSNPTLSAKESAPFPVILRDSEKLANIQRLTANIRQLGVEEGAIARRIACFELRFLHFAFWRSTCES